MATTATFPALGEVFIVCVDTPDWYGEAVVREQPMVSQVLPGGLELERFVRSIRDLANEELSERGVEQLPPGDYRLYTTDHKPLDHTRTLQELGISNADVLVLAPSGDAENYEAQYEQLSTGLARIGKKLIKLVDALTAAQISLILLSMVAVVIAGLGLRLRTFTDSPLGAAITGGVGIVLALCAVACAVWWPEKPESERPGDSADPQQIVDVFGWLGAGLITVGAYMVLPDHLGAPHLLLAGVVAVVGASVLASFTRRHTTAATAVITVCVVGALSVIPRLFWAVPGQWLGLITLLVLLIGLFYAERIALRVCRIRPPFFGRISSSDIFATDKGLAPDEIKPVDNSTSDPSPTGTNLAQIVLRVHAVLAGLLIGLSSVLPLAVWAILMPGAKGSWLPAVEATLFVIIFITRGRRFRARLQSVPLVFGAVSAALAGVVKYVIAAPGNSVTMYALAVGAMLVFGLCGFAAAVIVPKQQYHPPVRLFVEWLEILAIVFTFPVAAFTASVFAHIRGVA